MSEIGNKIELSKDEISIHEAMLQRMNSRTVWKPPVNLKEYLNNIPINHFFGYFDMLLIEKYNEVLAELGGLAPVYEDDGSDTSGGSEFDLL